MATQQLKQHDYAWWVVSCAFAVSAEWLVNNRDFGLTGQSRYLAEALGLFAGGLFIGLFCPRGAWRWGVAAFITLSLLGAAQFFGVLGPEGSASTRAQIGGFATTILGQAPENALRAVMVALGGFVTSLLGD